MFDFIYLVNATEAFLEESINSSICSDTHDFNSTTSNTGENSMKYIFLGAIALGYTIQPTYHYISNFFNTNESRKEKRLIHSLEKLGNLIEMQNDEIQTINITLSKCNEQLNLELKKQHIELKKEKETLKELTTSSYSLNTLKKIKTIKVSNKELRIDQQLSDTIKKLLATYPPIPKDSGLQEVKDLYNERTQHHEKLKTTVDFFLKRNHNKNKTKNSHHLTCAI